ncbi:hypothetical protein QTP86_026269 [Hemibagrus guttatus]|nr:hypothetical protein QTP86_026269 [Hemibagrus guttatus]
MMKRSLNAADEAPKWKKAKRDEASSDEDDESSQRTTSHDSSQSESLSDAEDQRPSFSKPSASQNASGSDASQSATFSMYNSVSQKLMAKMGFKEGEGLGKFGQGRKEIVEASTQRGRRGLGLTLEGFEGDLNVEWQDEPEPSALEEVSWFPECTTEMPDSDELRDWMTIGKKAFDCVPRGILWEVLWEYGIRGPLLRAVRSLYNWSRSLVRFASCNSDLFPVHVGLRQGCPLSPVLFIVFMDRISRRSQWLEGVRFEDHRISSLIFADDVVLLASSSLDLQHALGRFAAKCEAAGMRVSTSKSEAMVLDRKKVACTLQVGGEFLPQVEEFKYLGVLFTSGIVRLTSISDASGTSPWGGVPGTPHREETPGKTQDTLERPCLSAGLGTPRGPSGRAGGSGKMTIDDETEFCSEELLHLLLRCKSVFDDLEGEEMRRARTRSNPYETIRGAFFLNRAAMKMANMDHVFDYMFTNPKDSQGKPLFRDRESELLYFGDVCAGPGGFSEYVLWRKRWHAKGFGMTLKGANDFKLEDFYSAPSELFEPYYGEGGIDGDGDITRPENISAFRNFVLESTEKRGLHFLMADGGFSVEGQENLQEILSKQLLLCQFLTALSVVRTGGHFVCKTFDLFTPFSVGLIYLLYLCFERVSLFKPVTSRPANSERYVVCKNLKPGSDAVRDYLFKVNLKLNHLRQSESDVTDVVPLEIIKGDTDFFQHMMDSNERHCSVQIKALAKIHAYVRDTTLSESRQADIRKECFRLWGIPDQVRVAPSSSDPKSKFYELVNGSDVDSFNSRPTALSLKTLDKLQHVLDHRCIVGGGEQIFLLALGKSQIYTWDGKSPVRWRKLENFKLELPRDTLLSVEIVQELKGEGKAQRRINAVHVLDALVLNGTDVRDQHFNQRIQMAEKFVKAVSKPSRPDMNPIRVKEVYRLEEMDKIFVRLEMKVTKSSGGMPRLSYTGRDDRHFLPSGLYIIKTVRDPWTMAFSKSSMKKFFYNKQTKQSTYVMDPTAIAPFDVCHQERLFWAWEEGVRVHDSQNRVDPLKLSKDTVLSFIRKHCHQWESRDGV